MTKIYIRSYSKESKRKIYNYLLYIICIISAILLMYLLYILRSFFCDLDDIYLTYFFIIQIGVLSIIISLTLYVSSQILGVSPSFSIIDIILLGIIYSLYIHFLYWVSWNFLLLFF